MNGEKGSLVTESLFYFSRSGKAQAATRQFYQAQKSKKPALKAGFLNLAPLTGIAFASSWLINKLNLKTLPVKTTRMTTNQN
ncbi:hypothetical protein [Enterobacter kobei]|uniref:hypothetical protein n=1 Tax=Enterobacter kobei TaxID=208224 RepID=UPI002FD00EF7